MRETISIQEPPYTTDRKALEDVCVIAFIKSSGPGGQHRNKRETGVRLRHPPSGVVVTATERRSQARNRALAFARLAERLEALNIVPVVRKPCPMPEAIKRKRLEAKRQRAQLKKTRARVGRASADW